MLEIQKKQVWQWLGAALLILVVPNLIFWIVQAKVFMRRGFFVWEYMLLACLYPYISRKLFIVLWVLLAIYDMIFATCSLFFMDLFEILHALVKIPAMPVGDMLKWAGVLIVFVGITIALVKLMERYNRQYPFLKLTFLWPLILGMLFLDFFNGQGPWRKWSVKLYDINSNIVSMPTWSLVQTVRMALLNAKEQEIKVEYMGSVAQKAFAAQPDSAADKKQVMILVESLGILNDSALQQEVIAPLYQLDTARLYHLQAGRNQFKYLTQAGEFREITGYLFHSYQAFKPWVKQKSIFIKKQQEGYHVIGLHGFTSEFYKRKDVWPALGVQETMFAEDFRKLSMPLCGTTYFQGICDTSVTTWLFNNLKKQPERKEFYYWVTLSNHLPIVEIHDDGYNLFAAKWKKKGMNENVLQMAYRHQLLFKDIAHKLSQPGLPKPHVLLVGDHAPPFIDPADRAQYDAFHVQYVELVPN